MLCACGLSQEVLNAWSWALTRWGGVMLVVLASVAAAFRIISESEERGRPVVGERASQGHFPLSLLYSIWRGGQNPI